MNKRESQTKPRSADQRHNFQVCLCKPRGYWELGTGNWELGFEYLLFSHCVYCMSIGELGLDD
jgi:hypothetical protein